MLSAHAYSFRMKSRLAISLSWIGGYCNVIAFISCGTYASHVTGTTTNLGHDLVRGHWSSALFFGYIWSAFFFGAVAAALLIEAARRRGSASKYIQPMAVEMVLLTLFAIVLRHIRIDSNFDLCRVIGIGVISFAMGLQNATITNVSGAVVRTTHLTGVTTDLGLEGTQFLIWCRDRIRGRRWARAGRVMKVSQRHPSFLRVLLLASIIGSFLLGAAIGTFCYDQGGPAAMTLPVAFLAWIIWVDYRTPIADVREIDLLGDTELQQFGIMRSLLPAGLGIWRVSCRQKHAWHRPPDFAHWVERVPPHWRVIVLALSPLTRFDRNAIIDLENAIARLRRDGRKLILSGINPAQYRDMVQADIESVMDLEDLCPDLEFAIARGIDLASRAPSDRNSAPIGAREFDESV